MRRALLPCVLVGLAVLAGCSSGDDDPAAAPETTALSTSSAAPSSAASGDASGGCAATGDGVPAGSDEESTVDVDGDGQPDTAWIAGQPTDDAGVTFGVTTASGATFTSVIRSASPIARSVLVADVTGEGELVALASDGRQVLLYGISDCQLVPEQDEQGQQYAFDLGFTGFGTGVGCEDADGDGVGDLLGLLLQPPATQDTEATVQRTIVELDGPAARNGATSTAPAGDEAQQGAARSVTCGDLSLDGDGVTSGP